MFILNIILHIVFIIVKKKLPYSLNIHNMLKYIIIFCYSIFNKF